MWRRAGTRVSVPMQNHSLMNPIGGSIQWGGGQRFTGNGNGAAPDVKGEARLPGDAGLG